MEFEQPEFIGVNPAVRWKFCSLIFAFPDGVFDLLVGNIDAGFFRTSEECIEFGLFLALFEIISEVDPQSGIEDVGT